MTSTIEATFPSTGPSAGVTPVAGIMEAAPGFQAAMAWIGTTPRPMLIGGRWVAAASGRTFETIDPATGRFITTVAEADAADVDVAVLAARTAFESPEWTNLLPARRTRLLLDIADAVDRHADELAFLETIDSGVPLSMSVQRIAGVAEMFRYYAGWPTKMLGATNPTDPARFIYSLREPMGVCALINAWNVPITMAAMKLAPAIAAGNASILKPAELTPLSTLRLAEVMEGAGLPAGIVNILPGPGSTAGAAMAAHPGIDKIAFTGSTAVGAHIMRAAAGNMKKVTLELGGKSPNIIFADANIDKAIEAAVVAFCRNTGQICSAGTRLFVQEGLHDEVAERVAARAATYRIGSPFAADTQLGPVISERQRNTIQSYMDLGREEGATVALGGKCIEGPGFFLEPTVFSGVSNQMRIAREEIFGPVLSIIPFKDEADAVLQGNDTEYGLAAAVWTRDVGRAHRVARALKSGRVWVNTYAETDVTMAMGGYKQSGFGREMGAESIDAYTQTKSVLMRLD
jgi:acyl-CoA reductase-like NAD-dependent aldehyde dehydrogenase